MTAARVEVGAADEFAVWSQDEAFGRVSAVTEGPGDGSVNFLLLSPLDAGVERLQIGLVNGDGGGFPQPLAFKSLDSYAKRIEETHQGQGTNEAAQFLKKTADSLFTNQIDAHVEQIKTQGRTGRFALRLLRERSDRE